MRKTPKRRSAKKFESRKLPEVPPASDTPLTLIARSESQKPARRTLSLGAAPPVPAGESCDVRHILASVSTAQDEDFIAVLSGLERSISASQGVRQAAGNAGFAPSIFRQMILSSAPERFQRFLRKQSTTRTSVIADAPMMISTAERMARDRCGSDLQSFARVELSYAQTRGVWSRIGAFAGRSSFSLYSAECLRASDADTGGIQSTFVRGSSRSCLRVSGKCEIKAGISVQAAKPFAAGQSPIACQEAIFGAHMIGTS